MPKAKMSDEDLETLDMHEQLSNNMQEGQTQTEEETSISKYAKEQLKLVKGKRKGTVRKAKKGGRKETHRPSVSVEQAQIIKDRAAHYSNKSAKVIATEFGVSESSIRVLMRDFRAQGIMPKTVSDISSFIMKNNKKD